MMCAEQLRKGSVFILLIPLLGLISCTTMKTIDLNKTALKEYLRVGDHVVAYEKSGRIVDMRFVLIEDNKLRGSLNINGMVPVEVDIDNVVKIDVERTDGAKTTGAVVGGVLVAPFVIFAGGLGMGAALEGY